MAEVKSNKTVHNFWKHFLSLFFSIRKPCYMVWFILFILFALIDSWSILTSQKVFSGAITQSQMDHTMQKGMANCDRRWRQKLCSFLFEVTCAFGKIWIKKVSHWWFPSGEWSVFWYWCKHIFSPYQEMNLFLYKMPSYPFLESALILLNKNQRIDAIFLKLSHVRSKILIMITVLQIIP